MTDKELRPLLAVAQAKLTMGLLLFTVATTVLAWSLSDAGSAQFQGRCGVTDEPERRPHVYLPVGVSMVEYQRGEKLFTQNCASCHKPDMNLTGPALKGANDRWAQSGGDIYAWVKNSQGYLRSSGDNYAKALFEQWKESVMTPNAVSNEDIDAILYYADNYQAHRPSQRRVVAAVKAQDDQFDR
jgi:cytochrome c551/c552